MLLLLNQSWLRSERSPFELISSNMEVTSFYLFSTLIWLLRDVDPCASLSGAYFKRSINMSDPGTLKRLLELDCYSSCFQSQAEETQGSKYGVFAWVLKHATTGSVINDLIKKPSYQDISRQCWLFLRKCCHTN